MDNNNKRIAKNTFFLYFRMIIVSVVALFTTRVTLNILGIEDFGIYNVVAGAIGFMGVLNGSMISAAQRFLSFELGRKDLDRYSKVFSMLSYIFLFFGIIILVFAFVVKNWVIGSFLVIPEARIQDANLLYSFAVITFAINLIGIPYMSSIVAYEKMKVYAYVGLFEVIIKLLVVYLLYVSKFDRLVTYGFLMMATTIATTLIYQIYCFKNLKGCRIKLHWERDGYQMLTSYMGWNLFGSVTTVMNMQGQAILLNLFFGPVVNAAKAIADKINAIVASFSSNFFMAVRPQIIKNYATGNRDYVFEMVYGVSKFAFYLLFIIAWPLIVNMKSILNLWLGNGQVTIEMVYFSQLILVFALINVFEQPITVLIQATGKIKLYEIVIGFSTLLFLPVCYIFFKGGARAYSSLIILAVIYLIAQFLRLLVAKKQVNLSIKRYFNEVALPVTVTVIPTVIITLLIGKLINLNGMAGILLNMFLCFIITFSFIYFLGVKKKERNLVIQLIRNKISSKK